MAPLKLWLVTKRVPPERCGVGDYTARMAEALARHGHHVEIVTSVDQKDRVGSIPVWNGVSDWNRAGFSAILERAHQERPDRIFFQWAPFLYHRRGWNPWAGWAAWSARSAGLRWETVVHEPFVDWSWGRAVILAFGQRMALGALIAGSYRVHATILPWVELLARDFPGATDKVFWGPVGSTIRPTGVSAIRTAKPRIGIFSPLGSGKEPEFIEKVWRRVGPLGWEMVVIGVERSAWPGDYRDDPNWRFTGQISESDVSSELASLDALLSPFVDGVSGRRTSAFAALAHGVPLVTNHGRLTDAVFFGPDGLPLVPKEAGAFALALRSLVASPEERRRWVTRGRAFYLRYFDWDVLAERLLAGENISPPVAVSGGL